MRVFLVMLWVLAGASSASAQGGARPCAEGSAEADEARAAVRALAQRISTEERPSESLMETYSALLEHPCFRILADVGLTQPETPLSLSDWWRRGGEAWFNSAFQTASMTVPPEPVTELSFPPGDPRTRLLCPGHARSCGTETDGWRVQANAAFRRSFLEHGRRFSVEQAEQRERCATESRQEPAELRYGTWSRCISRSARQVAFPLGPTRAPSDGWLLIRGRRGHYSFCEELRAYHLGSGAAYVARECSQLPFLPAGTAAPNPDAAGRVHLSSIREVAWNLLFADQLQSVRPTAVAHAVPVGYDRAFTEPMTLTGIGGGSFWMHSGQTQLSWSWVSGQTVRASGTFTWPDSSNPAENYAGELLRTAEASFDEQCAPRRLPGRLLLSGDQSQVSSIDASPSDRRGVQQALQSRIRALRPARCR